MVIAIIGTGLIGGSMAMIAKKKGFTTKVIGVEANAAHAAKALSLGLVDEVLSLEAAVNDADFIVLAVPVNVVEALLPQILNWVDRQVIMDVGSIKEKIIAGTTNHPKAGRFVPTHPMWGTEFSGPEAALGNAFINKAAVICNSENCDRDALALVEEFYRILGMHLVYMDAAEHDVHVAYVSHISHITSFALANTVLEKERGEDAIFELASGGFESTVRLAKSNAATWAPIFMLNRDNVLDVLNEHISQLKKFKACLEKENYEYLEELMNDANKIKRILK
jgi:prephenate dehydrogenase